MILNVLTENRVECPHELHNTNYSVDCTTQAKNKNKNKKIDCIQDITVSKF